MIFAEAFNHWWAVKKIALNEGTVRKKESCENKHILSFLGDMNLDAVDDLIIIDFVRHEQECGNRKTHGPLAPITVRKELQTVKNVLSYALDLGWITHNPAISIKISIGIPKEPIISTPAEVDLLISVARPKWFGDIILLAYQTGMRRGEIYGLKWDNIDFDQKTVYIERSIASYAPGVCLINPPKTTRSRRYVMLSAACLEMLRRRYEHRTSDEWVFANQYGKLICPWYTVKYIHQACDKAHIPRRSFHSLRHTHITELMTAGKSITMIQQRVGHSTFAMTLYYTHMSISAQQDAVNFLDSRK